MLNVAAVSLFLLGAPVDADPELTLKVKGDVLKVYAGDELGQERLCFSYRETGSLVRRNSCAAAPVFRVHHVNMRGMIGKDVSRHQRLNEDARFIVEIANHLMSEGKYTSVAGLYRDAVREFEKGEIFSLATLPSYHDQRLKIHGFEVRDFNN
ncbi:MAG: hypothetical protein AAF654_10505 [Myxococcota bacterium]